MPDMVAIGGTISSLKATFDLSKSLLGVRDAAVSQGKLIELQSQILTAQSEALLARDEQATLLERLRLLEQQLARLEVWNVEKERYQLEKLSTGVLVYTLKKDARETEPAHQLCAACYQDRRKSILQPVSHNVGRCISLDCPDCGTRVYQSGAAIPGHVPPTKRQP